MLTAGTFGRGLLPTVLRGAYVGHQTGLLHLLRGETAVAEAADERRSVRFHRGHIVHAQSNLPEEQLGATLVRQGLIRDADLVLATQTVRSERRRLGEVLAAMGIMPAEKLEDVLALQVHDVLVRLFAWEGGRYTFELQDPDAPLSGAVSLKVSTGELILQATRAAIDPEALVSAVVDLDGLLRQSSDPLLRFQRISLSPADGFLVSRIDGTLTSREVLALGPLSPEDTARSLYGVLCTGIVEVGERRERRTRAGVSPSASAAPPVAAPVPVAPPAVAARPMPVTPPVVASPVSVVPPLTVAPSPSETTAVRRQDVLDMSARISLDHFAVLGVPVEAAPDQIKSAYLALARRFHPDSQHDPALSDLRDVIVKVFVRLGAAWEVLRDDRRREQYAAPLRRALPVAPVPAAAAAANAEPPPPEPTPVVNAADLIRRAELHIRQDQYWEAIQMLEEAVRASEGKLQERARVMLARAYLKNPRWIREAEAMLLDVVAANRRHSEAYFLLGAIYDHGRLTIRATEMFERVLEIDPEHTQARGVLAVEPSARGERLRELFRRPTADARPPLR